MKLRHLVPLLAVVLAPSVGCRASLDCVDPAEVFDDDTVCHPEPKSSTRAEGAIGLEFPEEDHDGGDDPGGAVLDRAQVTQGYVKVCGEVHGEDLCLVFAEPTTVGVHDLRDLGARWFRSKALSLDRGAPDTRPAGTVSVVHVGDVFEATVQIDAMDPESILLSAAGRVQIFHLRWTESSCVTEEPASCGCGCSFPLGYPR